MRLSSGYEVRRARVEMIPLMDVMFLLLVFFIYAMLSMVLHRGLKVALPGASTAQLDKREYVAVTITRDNRVYVDGDETTVADVVRRVTGLARAAARVRPVFIEGDRAADLGLAIQILDGLRRDGIREVSFACSEESH